MKMGDLVTVSDKKVIEKYNTDTFRQTSEGDIPVYYNLADVPIDYYPDGTRIEIHNSAHPFDITETGTNFRVASKGSPIGSSYPAGIRQKTVNKAVKKINDTGTIGQVVIPWALIIKLTVYVVALTIGAVLINSVITNINNAIMSSQLPGGASGTEEEITENRKLVTFPDGSWALFDTSTGEIVKEGEEPAGTFRTLILYAAIGIGGIVVLYLVIKNLPEISESISGALGKGKKALGD